MGVVLVMLLALEFGPMVSDEIAQKFEARIAILNDSNGERHEFAYRMLKPEPEEPEKKYPVILFLHGAGERGDDNKSQLEYLPEWMAMPVNRRKYPCFLIAPQCPAGQAWTWEGRTPGEVGPLRMAAEMLGHTKSWEQFDQSRVYLTGLSKGGYGVWELAVRMPEQFAAVVPVCGGGDEKRAAQLVGLPIWAWHGDADDVVSVEESRTMIAAIKKAGGNPKYSELPGVGHDESWRCAYFRSGNVLSWMFEQVNQRP